MSRELAPTEPQGYVETPREGHERLQERVERHGQSPERYNEKEAHQAAENARREAIKESILSKEQGREKRTHQAHRHNSSHGMSREDRNASFDQTMEQARKEMPRAFRPLSKFIHNPVIEQVSEFLGKTIFRPNAILAGGLTAFVVVLALYFYAKYAGFTLQGSETIVAFGIGWLFGLLFDLFKVIFTGKR